VSRLPIRIRLTLPFALAMALVLAALGGYVYVRVGSTLLSSTDQSLLAQATEAMLRVDRGKPPLDLDSANGARFAQVVDSSGVVVFSPPVDRCARPPRSAARVTTGACSRSRTRPAASVASSSSPARSTRAASRSNDSGRSCSSRHRSRCSSRHLPGTHWRARLSGPSRR
jgi:hypothetical protein